MSQRNGFGGGFFLGAIVGSVIGGVVGSVLAKRGNVTADDKPINSAFSAEDSIEIARRSLEEKIAQLNLAIDDVREQLGAVHGKEKE